MRGGLRAKLAQALLRVGVGAAALLVLALVLGLGAYRLTAPAEAAAPAAPATGVDDRFFVRPPPELLFLEAPRARPPAERQAVARLVDPRPSESAQVQALAQALSVQQPSAGAQPSSPAPSTIAAGDRLAVTLSFYYCRSDGLLIGDGGGFCGFMRDGTRVHSGAAACHPAELGQRFAIEGDPTGRIYRCEDTGSAVGWGHRDIWFDTSTEGSAWLSAVGPTGVIEVLP